MEINLYYIFVLAVIFYFLFKGLFVLSYVGFTNRYLFNNKTEFVLYLFNPLLNSKRYKDKYLKLYYYLGLILSISWSFILSFKFNEFIDLIRINLFIGGLYSLSILIFVAFLLYLSLFDIISFSIPEAVSKRMLLFALVVNLVFLLLGLLLRSEPYSFVFGLINLGSISNLLGGIIGGGLIWLIVSLSNEKAMGAGDVDILAGIGLMIGVPFIFYSFFYTLISASIISIIYVVIKKRYKGVLIPFIPFLSSGFIVCLVLEDVFLRIFNIY